MSLELLRIHEGLRLKPYRCTAGKLTVGYGRNLENKGISLEEAEYLLENDMEEVKSILVDRITIWPKLDEVRRSVLIDMCFNMGWGGLSKFKGFLAAVEDENWQIAGEEMEDSSWWGQVGSRAIRLGKMMESGEWPDDV